MRRHGDVHDDRPAWLHYHGERLLFQDGPFSDFSLKHGYHYGKLATGRHKGLWVRLAASPVEMGLIRADPSA